MAQHQHDDNCGCLNIGEPVHAPAPGFRFCRYRPLLWGDVPLLLEIFRAPGDAKSTEILHAIKGLGRALSRKLDKIGTRMSALTDVLADLDTATNEVAAKLDANTSKIAELTAALAAAQPGSDEAAALQQQINDAVTAIGAESARLHGLAADSDNPVPADGGDGSAPVDSGDGSAPVDSGDGSAPVDGSGDAPAGDAPADGS